MFKIVFGRNCIVVFAGKDAWIIPTRKNNIQGKARPAGLDITL